MFVACLLPGRGYAQSQQIKLKPGVVYTNAASHFVFPATIGAFEREPMVTHFDKDGKDMGIGYNELRHRIAATIFVYPIVQRTTNDALAEHFKVCKAQVAAKHVDVKLLSEGDVQLVPAGQRQDGLHATYTFTDNFAHELQPVRSELYLFTHRQWFVLFRITYPETEHVASETAIKTFLAGLAWP